MKGWEPRSWVALIIALTVFVIFTGITIDIALIHPGNMTERHIAALESIIGMLISGLFVWLGGRNKGD